MLIISLCVSIKCYLITAIQLEGTMSKTNIFFKMIFIIQHFPLFVIVNIFFYNPHQIPMYEFINAKLFLK